MGVVIEHILLIVQHRAKIVAGEEHLQPAHPLARAVGPVADVVNERRDEDEEEQGPQNKFLCLADKVPVLFTANLAPADLIRCDGRRRALTCPRDWGGVCWGHCRKYVVFVWKNGLAGYNDPRYMCPCPQMRLSEFVDTYVLTPTGRVALAGKVANPETGAGQDISR